MSMTKVTSGIIDTVDASKITGAMPAIDGSALTGIESGGGGKILQVVSVHDVTPRSQTVASTERVNISGLTASITPSSTSSKILISARWNGENSDSGRTHDAVLGVRRDGTDIGLPSAPASRFAGITQVLGNAYNGGSATAEAGSTMDGGSFEYLDSPNSVSNLTYTITYCTSFGNSSTVYTNRTVSDSDHSYIERLTSSITLWEIGA